MKFAANDKLVMTGDSITDCGRNRPVGEGPQAIGNGYVSLIDAALSTSYPNLAVRVMNTGVSGNTVRDLAARWQADVMDLEPDWLSVMIGINDVWRQFDRPRQPELHVLLNEYEDTLDGLLCRTRPKLKGLILLTPYFIETNHEDPMRHQMDRYARVVKCLARKHNATLVDTQAAFHEILQFVHPMAIAGDRVHPNQTGHMVIARAFLKALGFSF